MKLHIGKILNKKELILVAIFFIALVIIGYIIFFTSNHFDKQAPFTFEIKDGESFNSVTERLYEQSIIPSKFNFKVAGFIYGAQTKVKAARYKIPNDISYLDLLDLFVNGPADYLRAVKINDGQTIKWLGAKVKRDVKIDSTEFVNLANNKEFIKSLGLNASTLEGYLFSKTYKMYENTSPEKQCKYCTKVLQISLRIH